MGRFEEYQGIDRWVIVKGIICAIPLLALLYVFVVAMFSL